MSLGNRCGFYSRRDVYRTSDLSHAKGQLVICVGVVVSIGCYVRVASCVQTHNCRRVGGVFINRWLRGRTYGRNALKELVGRRQ